MSRYTSVLSAMLASQGLGLIGVTLLLLVSAEASPPTESFAWAFFAGLSGVAGLGFFYLALARGSMGVVAPLAALIGAGVPVLVAIVSGEATSLSRILGILMALLAVVLISLPARASAESQQRAVRIDLAELPVVVLAGLGFAGFFLGIDRASATGATWWPLAVVRVAGLLLVVAAIVVFAGRRRSGAAGWRGGANLAFGVDRFRASGRSLAAVAPLLLLTGAGDLGGNVFFVLARHADALSVAVVLSSLYPVVTTVLATLILRERLRAIQVLGVVLATLSVLLLR